MTTTSAKGTVVVYVRLCGDDESRECRELSFQVPDGISQRELIDNGFAIDGNEATKAVVPYGRFADRVPLSTALRQAQVQLMEWLGGLGYEVTFA